MCSCEPDFICARCRAAELQPDDDAERFEEMIGCEPWPEVAVPALADYEARP